jgi:hypothetical protein
VFGEDLVQNDNETLGSLNTGQLAFHPSHRIFTVITYHGDGHGVASALRNIGVPVRHAVSREAQDHDDQQDLRNMHKGLVPGIEHDAVLLWDRLSWRSDNGEARKDG